MNETTESAGRVVLYLRVSSKSQVDTDYDPEGLSIPAQRDICRRKARDLHLEVVGEYVELGRSGTSVQGRPEYQAMMQRISSQRDADYVMVYQLSRLNRNRVDDALAMVHMESVGAKLLSATENIDDTPVGQLTRGILASVNQYRSSSEGIDISRKMEHKARKGGTIGPAPLGYLNVKEEFEGRLVSAVAVDLERAPLIREGFDLYATGDYSLDRLQQAMADRGLTTRVTRARTTVRPVSRNKWHQMLSNPYYIGMIRYRGEVLPGRHEAIVPPEVFAKVQDVLAERSAPTRRDRTHFHYLKKQLFCGRCRTEDRSGKLVFTQASGVGGRYNYFVCMNRQRGVCSLPHLPVWSVEDHVVDYYDTIGLPDDFIQLMQAHVEAAVADEQAGLRAYTEQIQKRLHDLDQKEERLLDLAADGELPQTKIRFRLSALHLDRQRLTADLARSGEELAAGASALTKAMAMLKDVPQVYAQATDAVRGLLNDAFFKRLWIDQEGVTDSLMQEPFRELVTAADLHSAENDATTNIAPAVLLPKENVNRGDAPSLSDLLMSWRDTSRASSSRALLAEDTRFELVRV